LSHQDNCSPIRRLGNWLLGGALRRDDQHPIMGPLMRLYDPILRWTLRRKWLVITGAAAIVLLTVSV
jgi:Cu/Ag efflux pump CusA